MINSETESHACAEGTGTGKEHFEPCSCCRALAMVRMPSTNSGEAEHVTPNNGHKKHKSEAKRIVFKMPGLSGGRKKQPEPSAAEASAGTSEEKTAAKDAGMDDWHDDLGLPKKRKLWQGLDGLGVMLLGVVIPAMMLVGCCLSAPKRITLLLLNHPVETIAELSLELAIPLTILLLWSSLCKNNASYTRGRGVALGAAIGTSLVTALVCVAALFYGSADLEAAIGTNFTTGFCWIAFLSMASGAVGVYLVNRIRLARDFHTSRRQVVSITLVGALLSIITFVAAEARPWCIRLAELKAVSTQASERDMGLQDLRALDPERELRMECSDSRAAGLSGLFIPLKPTSQRELYFAVTGKPYSFHEFNNKDISFMPDDDLRRRIVGDLVPGLSLIRSSMDGTVHPDTLSSTLNWTYVFKNGSTSPQEARTELGLPPGAVITGLTLWTHGEPQSATVAAAGKAEGFTDSNWRQVNLNSPAIISDLGHGRMLLHCYPVQQEEELKVGITMVIPLKPDGSRAASLMLPTFIATNFDMKGNNHTLKLRSPGALSSPCTDLVCRSTADGGKTIGGTLTGQQLETTGLSISAARNELTKPIVVLDKMAVRLAQQEEKKREEKRRAAEANAGQQDHQIIVMIDGSKGVNSQLEDVTKALAGKNAAKNKKRPAIKTVLPRYVVEDVTRVAAPAPKHLVVVVDGSATVKEYSKELAAALAKLPSGIPAELIVASQEKEKLVKPVPLRQGLAALKSSDFVGGQNNLKAVVDAAELAGDRKGGAVLWVHGPQPALNEEIYIMSQYTATPAFYELQVGTGDTDTFDFFKNHSEIGPFTQVPQDTAKLTDDFAAFFSKWKPDSNDYAVSLSQTTVLPENSTVISDQEADELLALHASQECARLVSTRHIRKAARIAVAYGVVSPVSCALITDSTHEAEESADDGVTSANADAQQTQSERAASSDVSAKLQGATNGTIAPQGADATYVSGVNTAGTVRVNNLANLEALLNIIANLSEIGCALIGLVIALHGFARREPLLTEIMGRELEVSSGQRIVIGVVLIMLGLAVPGLINWFVASARDASLFS